jgi:two-component system, NarL family, nitrate/nitrite response regulator NarL
MAYDNLVEILNGKVHRKNTGSIRFVQKAPRLLLADDQQQVLRTVSSLLEHRYQIVGVAENGEHLIELARAESPDLVVLDIFMPVLNGIETAIRLKASKSSAKLIFLTVHEDRDFVDTAMSVGVLGYVLKPHLVTDLLPAVRNVLKGNVYISPSLLYS